MSKEGSNDGLNSAGDEGRQQDESVQILSITKALKQLEEDMARILAFAEQTNAEIKKRVEQGIPLDEDLKRRIGIIQDFADLFKTPEMQEFIAWVEEVRAKIAAARI